MKRKAQDGGVVARAPRAPYWLPSSKVANSNDIFIMIWSFIPFKELGELLPLIDSRCNNIYKLIRPRVSSFAAFWSHRVRRLAEKPLSMSFDLDKITLLFIPFPIDMEIVQVSPTEFLRPICGPQRMEFWFDKEDNTALAELRTKCRICYPRSLCICEIMNVSYSDNLSKIYQRMTIDQIKDILCQICAFSSFPEGETIQYSLKQ